MHGWRARTARRPRKRSVVAYADRLDAPHELRQLLQMCSVKPGRRAQRQAHAMQAHVPALAHAGQNLQRRAALTKKIFGVDFNKSQRGCTGPGLCHQLRVVRLAQANARVHLRPKP